MAGNGGIRRLNPPTINSPKLSLQLNVLRYLRVTQVRLRFDTDLNLPFGKPEC